jgi:hypothetical protein
MPGVYVQLTQLVLVPASFLVQALNDPPAQTGQAVFKPTQADPTIWAGIQGDVGNQIEGRLGQRYATPFASPFPAVVSDAALILAYEAVYARRVGEDKNPFSTRATAMREKLDLIGEGKQPLTPLLNRQDPSGNVIGSRAVTGRRTYF